MSPNNGLPYAYPLSDSGSCSPSGGDDGVCYCCPATNVGGLPSPASEFSYTGGQVIWKLGTSIPTCP